MVLRPTPWEPIWKDSIYLESFYSHGPSYSIKLIDNICDVCLSSRVEPHPINPHLFWFFVHSLFYRLVMESPVHTPESIKVIRSFCEDEVSMNQKIMCVLHQLHKLICYVVQVKVTRWVWKAGPVELPAVVLHPSSYWKLSVSLPKC